jgi:hypothetical protein
MVQPLEFDFLAIKVGVQIISHNAVAHANLESGESQSVGRNERAQGTSSRYFVFTPES